LIYIIYIYIYIYDLKIKIINRKISEVRKTVLITTINYERIMDVKKFHLCLSSGLEEYRKRKTKEIFKDS